MDTDRRQDEPRPAKRLPPLQKEQIGWRWRILTATYSSYAGYYLCRKAFSVCKKDIGDAFALDSFGVSHIWTAFLLAYMIGQFVNGMLGRKLGPRVLLLTGMGISLGCNIVFGFSNSFGTFIGFMILNGLAQASGWPGNVGGIAHWLRKEERGKIMGVWNTNYLAGNLSVKFLAGFMLGYAGWRTAFWACSAGMGLIWLLVYFWHRNRPEDVGLAPILTPEERAQGVEAASDETGEIGMTMGGFFRVLTNPVIVCMGLTYFTLKFLRYSLDSWLPYFLTVESGLASDMAAYYSSIFDWAGFASVILAGWALDRVFKGNWRMLCAVMAFGMTVAYVLVLLYGTRGPLVLACLYGLVGFMLYGPDSILNGAGAITSAGPRDALSAVAVINGIGSLGPVIQEPVIGLLYRQYNSFAPFKIVCICMSAAATLMLVFMIVQARRSKQAAGVQSGMEA